MSTFPSGIPSHDRFSSYRPTSLIYPSSSPAPEHRSPSNNPTGSMYPTKQISPTHTPSIEIPSDVPSPLPSIHPSSSTKPFLSPENFPETDIGWKWMDNSVVVTIWIFFLFAMIVFPCIGTSGRRTICRRRIVERRWNVGTRTGDPSAVDSANTQRCGDDKEDLRKKGLMKKFEKYTKKISEDDFTNYDGQEFESCKLSYHSKADDDSSSFHSTRSPFIRLASYLSFSDVSKKSDYGSRSVCDEIEIVSKGKDVTYDDDASTSHDEEDISLESFGRSLSRASSTQAQLVIPPAGVSLMDYENNLEMAEKIGSRVVPAECSICLTEYAIGDRICWSSFCHCKHVYHEDCIIQWFLTSAKTEDGAREDEGDSGLRHLMEFRTSCPNCRQKFI